MATTVWQLNSRDMAKQRRNEPFASHPPVQGIARDEEPPTSSRMKGDSTVLRITPDVPIRTHRKGREEEKRYIDDTLDIRRIAGRYNTDR
ncbi:hypothetical protein TESG_08495 [Trichophyton tonsurans CBS 112818]|uniref:Uncharacterized protein n=2 Tax=Trichophyton TaxID=5550 RepID=F2PQU0_TRIEC|nr:hypothetical protein TESG_08495 [Trichophyton tonsurans CBS 112818]EGE04258.1 hypothetical protein TEQG_08655 [Trichophyton equinum CBS 127.97]